MAAARIFHDGCTASKPARGRYEHAEGSREGLFELKIHPPGKKHGSPLRALVLHKGGAIWVAAIFQKHGQKFPPGTVAAADRLTRAWKDRMIPR